MSFPAIVREEHTSESLSHFLLFLVEAIDIVAALICEIIARAFRRLASAGVASPAAPLSSIPISLARIDGHLRLATRSPGCRNRLWNRPDRPLII